MLLRQRRWGHFRKDPKTLSTVVKRIPERARRRYYSVLSGTGSPAILWQTYYAPVWTDISVDKCYCFSPQQGEAQGNLRHEFCFGSGFVDYYQRWGYEDKTYWPLMSNPPELEGFSIEHISEEGIGNKPVWRATKDSYLVITHTPKRDVYRWIWLRGAGMFSDLPTVEIVHSGGVDEYIVDCYERKGNYCKFKVDLVDVYDQTITARLKVKQGDIVDFIRFRSQWEPPLNELDPRFPEIDFPAILVGRDRPRVTLKPDETRGIKMVFPMKFWTIDVEIHPNDVLWILTPPFNAYRYIVSTEQDAIEYSVVGHPPVITRVAFSALMIRSIDDRMGIVFKLE